jgi:hypothetical protein
MGKGTTFDNDLLLLILNATTIANLAQNAVSSPLTSVYVALHSADPSGGDQTTSEIAYTSYARVAVARTSGGWTITAGIATPVAPITFPQCTGGSANAAYFSVGYNASGASKVLYTGQITPNIAISNGVTPQLTTASTIQET